MISTNILIIATMIHIWYKPGLQFPYLVVFILLNTFLLLQKSSNLPICLLYTLLVFVGPLRSIGKLRKILSFSTLAILVSYSCIVGSNVDRAWNYSYSGTTLLWQLGNQSPASNSFRNFLEENNRAPECVYSQAPFEDVTKGIVSVLKDCSGGGRYVRTNLKYDFAEFLFANPKAAIQLLTTSLGAVLTSSSTNYGRVVSLFPSSVDRIFFGETSPSLGSIGVSSQEEGLTAVFNSEPIWLFTPGLLWMLAGFSFGILGRRQELGYKYQYTSTKFAVPAILLLQISISALLLPSEWVRQSAPYFLPLLALMVLNVSVYFGLKKH
jgi:hypothetical protein